MVIYSSLRENVVRTINEVRGYPSWKIEDLLKEAESEEDTELRARWIELTFDICEDKEYCRLMGAERLTDDDFNRIKALAYVLVRKDKVIVLPFL